MIIPDKINKLIEERKQIPSYDDMNTIYKWDEILAVLGDNEEDVYNYLYSIDDDIFYWIEEIYEEITEKFQSERIEELFIKRHIGN